MKNILLGGLLAIGCFAAPHQAVMADPAGRVLAIVAANTGEPVLGQSADANREAMEALLAQVKTAGIPVELYEAKGDQFSCDRISAILAGKVGSDSDGSKFAVQPNDTVIFYYAGHGYANDFPPTDKFPRLQCSGPQAMPKTDLSLSEVMDQIFAMKPRLAIGVADACNQAHFTWQGTPKGVPSAVGLKSEVVQALFLDYAGMVVFSGSKRGEDSWYANQQHVESLFSQQFFGAVSEELMLTSQSGTLPKWQSIAANAIQPILPSLLTGDITEQDPQVDDFPNDHAKHLRALQQ